MGNKQLVVQRYNALLVFLVLALGVAILGCQSKNVVKKLTKVNAAKNGLENPEHKNTETKRLDGIVYRLPRTVIQVTVPVKRTLKQPGEFVDFAPCFFSDDEVKNSTKEESVSFSTDTPLISSRGEPDPSETYVARTKGNYFEAKTLLVQYTPSGLLTKGKATSTDNSLDFTLKTIGTVVGIGVGVAKSSGGLPAVRTLRWEYQVDDKTILIPSIECAKETIATRDRSVVKRIGLLRISSGTLPPNLSVEEAENCLSIAGGEPQDSLKPLCSISTLGKDATDASVISKFIELQTLHLKLQGRTNYFNHYSDIQENLNKIKNAKDEQERLLEQKRAADEGNGAGIQEKIEALEADVKASDAVFSRFVARNSIDLSIETDYDKAVGIYQKLTALQAQRDALVSTATNIPSDTFKAMVEKTDEAIDNYKAAFLGGKEEKIWGAGIEYIPKVSTNSILFGFSKNGGICINNSLASEQNIKVNPLFQHDDTTINPCNRQLTVSVDSNNNGNSDAQFVQQISLGADPKQTSGWYYRIPARGLVKVAETLDTGELDAEKKKIYKTSVLGAFELPVAQFGLVASIPAKSAGKTSISNIDLDESTGALKNFDMSSSPLLDETALKEVQSAAQTAIDASDPVAKRKRELELLQLQNQINEARKTLDKANAPAPSPTP